MGQNRKKFHDWAVIFYHKIVRIANLLFLQESIFTFREVCFKTVTIRGLKIRQFSVRTCLQAGDLAQDSYFICRLSSNMRSICVKDVRLV